ncbi:HNH endonuclease family protein [Corynebacterium epidermidicanis]|uniref:Putative DUF1524 family protein n=1 Tax=Corynebacterium epidermidicanis TaxID=1050174 RepID=A0A0G3GTH6_9CORY|nr:HNH endonuclease family protein [Corynebacterium epidermidicanis]AKK02853.1 putative DUF1524 family protein [Corynebacterium epidermidicanis]
MDFNRIFTVTLLAASACWLIDAVVSGTPRTPADLDEPPALSATLPYVMALPHRPERPDYQRDRFGDGWVRTGSCTTRHEVLLAQLENATLDDCRLSTGSRIDPYGSAQLSPDSPIEIDHVIPLSAAWDLGAHQWSDEQRLRFANDPNNLVATSRKLNQEKSDQLPAQWLPPRKSARCWYSRKVAFVAASYQLPLPEADIRAMKRTCLVSEIASFPIG